MELEKRFTNLELSQKLKELGFKQEVKAGDCYWSKLSGGEWRFFLLSEDEDGPESTPLSWCKAYSDAELGEILPQCIISGRYDSPDHERYFCYHNPSKLDENNNWSWVCPLQLATSEVDVRAEMLIYLIKNKFIKEGDYT